MSKIPVAVQMYTLRNECQRDFVGTLRAVAALGYAGVEFAGYGGLTAARLKALLEELNLGVAGSHVGLDALENRLDEVMAYNLAIGNRDVVCPGVPAERRQDAGAYRQLAASLSAIGRRCREYGLQLSYHNHSHEFGERFGDQCGLDILMEADPAALHFELDVYWAQRAGVDPVIWLDKLGSRCSLIHLKDMAAGPDQAFADVGTGVIDFAAIFAAAGAARWYIVEHDACPGPALESVRISLENLRRMGKA